VEEKFSETQSGWEEGFGVNEKIGKAMDWTDARWAEVK